MSLFTPTNVTCPACSAAIAMDAVGSVNADRRPDLRDDILSGDFQRETCPSCGAEFRLAPEFTYLDIGQGLWIAAFPYPELARWSEAVGAAEDTFATAYGASSGPVAQEIGEGLAQRVVFGWPALREKIAVLESGLDDTALELAKLAILRGGGSAGFGDGIELRFLGFDDDEMVFAWISGMDEEVKERLALPRALYDDIAADQSPWGPLADQVGAAPLIDMQKLIYGTDAAA